MMAQGHAGSDDEGLGRPFLEPMATPARSNAAPPAAAPRTAAGGAPRPAGDAAGAGAGAEAETGAGAGPPPREAVLLVLDAQLQPLPWESLPSLQHHRCAQNPEPKPWERLHAMQHHRCAMWLKPWRTSLSFAVPQMCARP